MLSHNEYVTMTAYLTFAGLGIFLNLIIVLMIFYRVASIQTPYLLLIFYFHISILGDLITALPYAFNFSDDWCLFNEAMKYYFSLMNILIIGILIQGNRSLLESTDSTRATSLNKRMGAYFLIFLFPCISFLPYSTSFYRHGNANNPFCTVTDSQSSIWPFIIQYIWVVLVLLLNFVTNIYVLRMVIAKANSSMLRRKFFLTIGGYSTIAALSWIARLSAILTLRADSDDDGQLNEVTNYDFYRYFPIVLASIFYAALFFVNRKSHLMLERAKSTAASDHLSFSAEDILDIIESGEENPSLFQHVVSLVSGNSFSRSFRSSHNSDVSEQENARNSASSELKSGEDRTTFWNLFAWETPYRLRNKSGTKDGVAMSSVVVCENPLKTQISKPKESKQKPPFIPSPSSSPKITIQKNLRDQRTTKREKKEMEVNDL